MAIAKVILNGETLMDVTSDTPSASNMLNGIIATKNDGTKVTGNITNKSSTDLTVSGATVTAPAGYYANAASKAVSTTTHPNPSASITSSTGVVTASHTQGTGYVTGGTTTSTTTLTTQAAQTIYPSTADRTISSYRWLTGTQTIKSVTTSNLTAANIAEGVVVKVGDANNASRITQVTGTHSGATSYTATISGNGSTTYCYVTYSGTKYYSNNGTFTFKAGDTLTIYCRGNNVIINGDTISLSGYSYTYTLPIGDIDIELIYSGSSNNSIKIWGLIQPTGNLDITSNGTYNIYGYSSASVNVPPEEYYQIYRSIANKQALSSTITSLSEWLNSFSLIGQGSMMGVFFNGSMAFNNVTTISSGGFGGSPYNTAGFVVFEGSFPMCTSLEEGAFAYNKNVKTLNFSVFSGTIPSNFATNTNLKEIYMPLATGIGYSAFQDCRTLSIVSIPLCTSISHYAFASCYANLTSVDFPACIIISNSAFAFCSALITANFSSCTTIGQGAFYQCRELANISFPACTSIATYAFSNCSALITANFPACTSIGGYAFQGCSALTTANFSVCTSISSSAFQSCYSLTNISFPACISIGSYAFRACYSLTTASFPACTSIAAYAFQSCYSLTTANFPVCTSINTYAFQSCFNLISLYLNNVSSIPYLATNAFTSTPIGTYSTSAGRYGSIFVPSSLFESFKTATNWATYSSRMVSV